jgi:hypothetical protein
MIENNPPTVSSAFEMSAEQAGGADGGVVGAEES